MFYYYDFIKIARYGTHVRLILLHIDGLHIIKGYRSHRGGHKALLHVRLLRLEQLWSLLGEPTRLKSIFKKNWQRHPPQSLVLFFGPHAQDHLITIHQITIEIGEVLLFVLDSDHSLESLQGHGKRCGKVGEDIDFVRLL